MLGKKANKVIIGFGIFVGIALVGILVLLFVNGSFLELSIVSTDCGDGTLDGECSGSNYCDSGILVQKASVCGCSDLLTQDGDSCISEYQTNGITRYLKYVLDGKEGEIEFEVYEGMANYLDNLPKVYEVIDGNRVSVADIKIENINEEQQRELLLPLVAEIQNLASDKEDQARIAISLVQNIEYGFSNKTFELEPGIVLDYARYPYEVLYDSQGLCGEKSELLAFILREIGFDSAFIHFYKENHEAFAIKCQDEYGIMSTGYCFIETTGPSIITDDTNDYANIGILSSIPEIIPVSEGGLKFDAKEEYEDTDKWIELNKQISQSNGYLSTKDYKLWKSIIEKYGLEPAEHIVNAVESLHS